MKEKLAGAGPHLNHVSGSFEMTLLMILAPNFKAPWQPDHAGPWELSLSKDAAFQGCVRGPPHSLFGLWSQHLGSSALGKPRGTQVPPCRSGKPLRAVEWLGKAQAPRQVTTRKTAGR